MICKLICGWQKELKCESFWRLMMCGKWQVSQSYHADSGSQKSAKVEPNPKSYAANAIRWIAFADIRLKGGLHLSKGEHRVSSTHKSIAITCLVLIPQIHGLPFWSQIKSFAHDPNSGRNDYWLATVSPIHLDWVGVFSPGRSFNVVVVAWLNSVDSALQTPRMKLLPIFTPITWPIGSQIKHKCKWDKKINWGAYILSLVFTLLAVHCLDSVAQSTSNSFRRREEYCSSSVIVDSPSQKANYTLYHIQQTRFKIRIAFVNIRLKGKFTARKFLMKCMGKTRGWASVA